MMSIWSTFLLVITLSVNLTFAQSTNARVYSLQDLKILRQNSNYNEFFMHALDVLPSKRSKEWKKMTLELGVNYLDSLLKKTIIDKASINQALKISTWPILRNDEFFRQKRDEVFLKDIRACFKRKGADCEVKVDHYYSEFNHDAVFDYALVKELAPYHKLENSIDYLWSYTQKLRLNSMSEFYCAKAPLSDILTEKLTQLAVVKKLNKELLHPDCFKALRPQIKKLFRSEQKQAQLAAKLVLEVFGSLSASELRLYNLISFMSSDQKSISKSEHILETFKEFKADDKIRTKALNDFLSLDPLPDTAFKNSKDKVAFVKLKILNQNFPELLDSYTGECVNYLSGTKKYKNGNPTPWCHQVFKMNNVLNIIPRSTVIRYQKATYFTKK